MFCVFGPVSASNPPLGYCHVRKSASDTNHHICTRKDCRGFAAKGKQFKTKSMCMHIAIFLSCFVANTAIARTVAPDDLSVTLAEKIKALPYVLPPDLLQSIAKRDACTLLGVDEGWPKCFIPELENCQLCGSPLNDTCIHPGQSRHSLCYLIAELNPFKQVEIKVQMCPSNTCSAMHQASVEKLGEIKNSGNCREVIFHNGPLGGFTLSGKYAWGDRLFPLTFV